MNQTLSAQLAIQRTLNEALVRSQIKNQAFSLRAFARKLNISHSALSEILNGKRKISKKMAERLARNLCLNPKEAKALIDLFPGKGSGANGEAASVTPYLELTTDHFHVISEWYHFAILSLIDTAQSQADAKWIAARLGIKVPEAQSAIDRMMRLSMIHRDRQGRLARTGIAYATPDEVEDIGLKKAHMNNLELARRSLESDPIHARDFTAITMAVNPSKLPVAKKMIREFLDKISGYLENDPKQEVYKMCVQLIPLSRKETSHET